MKGQVMKRMSKILLSSGLALIALSACTKELPYKEVYKEEVLSKPNVEGEWLYSSSMLNASRSSQDALPFSASQNKRVKLQWTDHSLQLIEMEQDSRFQANSTNNKLVLEVAVDHIDYQ